MNQYSVKITDMALDDMESMLEMLAKFRNEGIVE